jgi:hypothetical protein
MIKPFWIAGLVVVVAVTAGVGAPAMAAQGKFKAKLTPLQEAPICSSEGSGTFEATLSDDETTVEYELTYTLEAPVRQGHIHPAQKGVSGSIIVWLCQTPAFPDQTPPPNNQSPQCPASPATVTGRFTSANVIAIGAQGIAAGEFDELLRAMRNGVTYANVHSDLCGTGEVRGQIIRKWGPPHHRPLRDEFGKVGNISAAWGIKDSSTAQR